jgi:hypothetical protein
MYFATVDWATSTPSLNNSLWIRGVPHSQLARLISWIRSRFSLGIGTSIAAPVRRPRLMLSDEILDRPAVLVAAAVTVGGYGRDLAVVLEEGE